MRRLIVAAPVILALASCAHKRVAPPPAPPPPAASLLAAPPQQDWRDVPLTPGTWVWRGSPSSLAQYGVPGQPTVLAARCDPAARAVVFSRAGTAAGPTTMRFTTSFGPFTLAARPGEGEPSAIVASTDAHDPHLDQLAFSRGRFLVDVPGTARLVLPAWPEVARVIEDCRG